MTTPIKTLVAIIALFVIPAVMAGENKHCVSSTDGYGVLVPVEPTNEMLEAGDEQFGTYDLYRRMIAAVKHQKLQY